ncbi:GNAT family N-acetyltransferase [Marilutibacter chinensis]|uniref:GNAT family N-acetyltransferase n=1 Tax=Marilutibacter chinensis TaxID=2912247 RepID=A0ABS9HX57_9GAMM|nr:GNAT family N-acetyltransferase [Lysobacter chinensis]
MTDGAVGDAVRIRAAANADRDFILGFAESFSAFPLPAGRSRDAVDAGVRADIVRHLDERPQGSHFFVVEQGGMPAGFVHLLLGTDFFGGAPTCHVSDLAVLPACEGRGFARRLLAHAERFAREHACSRLTLSVFPGNVRARRLYEAVGYEDDLLRMSKPLPAAG